MSVRNTAIDFLLCLVLVLLGCPKSVRSEGSEDGKRAEETKFIVNHQNSRINELLEFYSELEGREIKAKDQRLLLRLVSLVAPEPVSREQAIALIEAVVTLEGMRLVKTGEKTLELQRYLTDEAVVKLKESVGISNPEVKYDRPRRPIEPPRIEGIGRPGIPSGSGAG